MPVRRPRRPTAVSAAFEADAGPELGCAGHLERPAETPNGEVRSLSVGRCVSRRVGRSSNVDGSISRLGLSFWGRVRALGLWVSHSRKRILVSRLFFASLDRSVAVFVRVCRHGSFVESLLSFDLDLSRSILIWLAELRSIGGVLSALGRGVARVPPPLAVRCALFSVDGGMGRFSWLN